MFMVRAYIYLTRQHQLHYIKNGKRRRMRTKERQNNYLNDTKVNNQSAGASAKSMFRLSRKTLHKQDEQHTSIVGFSLHNQVKKLTICSICAICSNVHANVVANVDTILHSN